MMNHRFIRALLYIMVSLALILTSCGGEGGGSPQNNRGVGQIEQSNRVSGRTAVLRAISTTPSNPLRINYGTQIQFNAWGYFSDNSVEDLTTTVVWTSSDTSIATISNAPESKGQAIAVSRGYCSISGALDGISGSTIVGIN